MAAALLRPGCAPNGTRNGLVDDACYLRCNDAPFLMTSWQDTGAWW